MGASTVSAHKPVRDALLDLQRQAGRGGGVVLEGRDIGTVVFPDAEVKFFLTARPEVRARRRFDELAAKGAGVTFEETLADVRRRDEQDTTRAVAPLRQAAGRDARRQLGHQRSTRRSRAWPRGCASGAGVEPLQGRRPRAVLVPRGGRAAGLRGQRLRRPPRRRPPAEPHWQDVFDTMPELLVVVRAKAARGRTASTDRCCGAPSSWRASRARCRRDARARRDGRRRGARRWASRPDTARRARASSCSSRAACRADVDPASSSTTTARPSGPRARRAACASWCASATSTATPSGPPSSSCRAHLGRRPGAARARAREAFAHPFGRPPLDLDPQALAIVRIDGPSLVERCPRAAGPRRPRRRRSVTCDRSRSRCRRAPSRRSRRRSPTPTTTRRPPPMSPRERSSARSARERSSPAGLARRRPGSITSRRRSSLTAPLPAQLVDALLQAGSAPLGASTVPPPARTARREPRADAHP